MPRSTVRSGPVAVVLAVLLSGALSGCLFSGDDGAEKLADRLAAALARYDVKAVPFTTSDAAKGFAELTAPIDGLPTKVDVGTVKTDDDTATAALTWHVEVAGGDWEHQTTAHLRKSGEEWQVVWRPDLVESSLKEGESLEVTTLKARRGRILGAGGAVLVEPRPVVRIGIDKSKVTAAQAVTSARRLAQALHLIVKPYVGLVRKGGPKQFVEALVVRREDAGPESGLSYADIPGAVGLADHVPLAPTRAFARQLLGTVGPVTAELVKDSDGRLAAGDDAGLSGLQRRYDEQLGGRSGRKVVAVDEKGERRDLFRGEPKDGTDLQLTLDRRLQQKADDLLAGLAPTSALVAIRPSTGAILAAASGPAGNGYDTATFGRYAPGSTFKVVSALALLRSGLAPDSLVQCPPTVRVNGRAFENYDDYPPGKMGTISLLEALANSCNTAFIGQRDRVKDDALAQAAASLGLGVDHDLGFPAYFGQVPAPAGETEAAADLIGQGKVLASPMAMATVLSSVLAGHTVVPNLLPDHTAEASPDKPLTGKEAAALRRMLRAVVEQGSGVRLADLGPGVLAKTGTAEFGAKSPPQTHAWMIGGVGDLAVAVFVNEGASGSGTAGPVLEEFLRAGLKP